jgi:hypothetical protein
MASHPKGSADAFRAAPPSGKALRYVLIVPGSFFVLGAVLSVAALERGVAKPAAAGVALGFGLGLILIGGFVLAWLWLWLINVRLLIGRGQVGYRNIFRQSRFWSQHEIGRVVEVAISYGRTAQPQRGIYVFGPDGRKLLVLAKRAWGARDLADFVLASGVQLDAREAPMTAKAARREFPNAFGWGSQHVMTATLITMAASVLLVLGGYFIMSATFHK